MVKSISRRNFLKQSSLYAGGIAATSIASKLPKGVQGFPYIKNNRISNKVIVLGFDGMDPNIIRRMMAEGKLPTFQKVMRMGGFGELQTTNPPQSPVAWSSFITGTNPGGHGIYDFVHRDPKSFTPYMSTSRSFDSKRSFHLGKWNIPLEAGKVELMRRGPAFWSVLEEKDIAASVFQIPANFPIESHDVRAVSGMGTPDLLGTYGTFTFYSETAIPGSEKFAGGRVVVVKMDNHKAETSLKGPKNSLLAKAEASNIPFVIHRDPWEQVVKIVFQDHKLLLKQGEWSEWVPIKFELMPMFASVGGMVRFYVKEVHPNLKIYVSPINVDPMDPSLPICSPSGYSKELSQAIGRFYTQGFPADSKALSTGVLSDDEYLAQAKIVLDENLRAFDYEFNRFNEGLFYFYFSNTDQNSHMLYRNMDPSHPLYNPDASPEVKNGMLYFYSQMDEVLKKSLSKVDSSTTLIALSDHGFSPFTREFHLSTWLVEQGYTVLTDPSKMGQGEFYKYVDWSRTKAYALGINGIYVNLKDREKRGWVDPADADQIKRELVLKLPQVIDPKTGKNIVLRAYRSEEIYSGPMMGLAPDIVVGYNSGYRISDEAVLGKFPQGIIGDRTDKWAADHCMDPSVVPGMLISNKGWDPKRNPGIWDMAPSILKAFSLEAPPEMTGKPFLEV